MAHQKQLFREHFSLRVLLNLTIQQVCIPVGCIPPACCPYLPACTVLKGVSALEGSALGGCLPLVPEWCLPVVLGVLASGPRGSACGRGGGVYPNMQRGRPHCGQISWHTLLKILRCPNFVVGGN